MKITLVVVGKTPSRELQDSILDYTKRLSHYTPFELVEASEEKLAKTLEKYERVILLDEHGKEHTSVEFSQLLEKALNGSVQSLAFVVGGPYGFNEEVRALATGVMSLSKMTFPHDLVRVIFLEQLYRAFTILKGEKYHHV